MSFAPSINDYLADEELCLWALARHARKRGNHFLYLEIKL